tara:strand:+ start:1641 stop:2261 length:621 start_codon:yes stop_codon:yes gene_type:complete
MSIVTYNNRSIANISAIPGAAKALTLIKTLTASSDSTLSFIDGSDDVVLDSTYPIYQFKFINVHPSANGAEFLFQGNAVGGSGFNETITSSAVEVYHNESDSSSGIAYSTYFDKAQGTSFQSIAGNPGNGNDESISGTLTLFNLSSTTFVKHFISSINDYNNNDFSLYFPMAGYFNTTSAIDEIQFKVNTGSIETGTIKLYGLKDS